MTAHDNLSKIFEKYRYDKSIETKSKTWFQQQTLLLNKKRINERKLFSQQKLSSRLMPGKLYMFYYDPLLKDSLPYYDKFPLVFPFKVMKEGFLGLNMHYLAYFDRVQLMSRLIQLSNADTLDASTRLKYSWEFIKGVAKFKTAAPCVKHYKINHVQSPFIEIPSIDWHTAMMLPVERFVGANKANVWANSWQQTT